MKDSVLYYNVGALLYCPANTKHIVSSLVHEKFGSNFSLAFCLEDTIPDHMVNEAENILYQSLLSLMDISSRQAFFMPKIFIRVRNPEQVLPLFQKLNAVSSIIAGLIFPKFDLYNADSYMNSIAEINKHSKNKIYMMPILESPSLIHLEHRSHFLYSLKEKLDSMEDLILNIRVGGNDLCNIFGFRRSDADTIYDIPPISGILSDIMTVFGTDYVVSGPVWEYYHSTNWEDGLKEELRKDQLCGFIGKTVIHPNQISVVNNAYKVSRKDYQDAVSILNWNHNSSSLVSGNQSCERMNEYKVHQNWAKKVLFLAQSYGISDK